MSILVSQQILDQIRTELARSTESFLLISAYCKLPLVEYFDSCIVNPNIEKKLVVRFRREDIISGASDLEIYPYCKAHGWKLYFRCDLHAKTYVFDRLRCIIGSANATSRGLSLTGPGNYEMATACKLDAIEAHKLVNGLLRGSIEMTDEIYALMTNSVSHHESSTTASGWSNEITNLFVPDFSLLFSEDFPQSNHVTSASSDDLLFLNLNDTASVEQVRIAFWESKCYNWLIDLISKPPEKEMYFGAITAQLHNTLLNEPKPYRRDVKQLLSNLLNWVTELGSPEIGIDRPNHSQRVYLKHSSEREVL